MNLRMGSSTVLRFTSPPKKVIVGNKNYFNIEFVDSDITVQALEQTTSNMFVYGDGFTYGFILKAGHKSIYDDLIIVKSRSADVRFLPIAKEFKRAAPKLRTRLFKVVKKNESLLKLEGNSFIWNSTISAYYSDLYLTNKSKETVRTDSLFLVVRPCASPPPSLKPVFEGEEILPNSRQRVRIFTKCHLGKKFEIEVLNKSDGTLFEIQWLH